MLQKYFLHLVPCFAYISFNLPPQQATSFALGLTLIGREEEQQFKRVVFGR